MKQNKARKSLKKPENKAKTLKDIILERKKNTEIEEVIKQLQENKKTKTKETIVKKLKPESDDDKAGENPKRWNVKDKDDSFDFNAYMQNFEAKAFDYKSLFSYLSSGVKVYWSEYSCNENAGFKADPKEMLSYEETEKMIESQIQHDLFGTIKEHDMEKEEKYKLWMRMEPAMWKFRFDLTNKYGYRTIVG